MPILIRNARILTLAGTPGPRRGAALGRLGIIADGDVLIAKGKILGVGRSLEQPKGATVIEAAGRVLMPGFVDCHTHACFAGSRIDEWELRRHGVPYLEILAKGGGIHSTVNAVRLAPEDELVSLLRSRLAAMLREGTTSVEIKSGYGLSTEAEMKMLRAIRKAAREWAGTVVPTALLGHAFEGDHDVFVARTIEETLPAISSEFMGVTVDAYCEKNAWSLEACERLFEAAKDLGHPVRVHSDQFNSMGMVQAAVRLGAGSVDHLEASTDADLDLLASSESFGVILPCTGFHTDGRYARGRAFADRGGAICLATNFNPGSSPTHSVPMAIALAVRECGLTPAEAIVASTVNAAALLGINDRGTIEPGKRADLVLLRHRDERALAYEFGGNPVDLVICAGAISATTKVLAV